MSIKKGTLIGKLYGSSVLPGFLLAFSLSNCIMFVEVMLRGLKAKIKVSIFY